VSLDMNRQHRFLNQIFGLCCISANPRKLAFVVGTQAAAQSVEQSAVRGRVALQAGKHQGFELDFVGRHACVSISSLVRPVWLQLTVTRVENITELAKLVPPLVAYCCVHSAAVILHPIPQAPERVAAA
jgi:hypothetical protein